MDRLVRSQPHQPAHHHKQDQQPATATNKINNKDHRWIQVERPVGAPQDITAVPQAPLTARHPAGVGGTPTGRAPGAQRPAPAQRA